MGVPQLSSSWAWSLPRFAWSVLARLEPLGHQGTSVIVVACAAIQLRGRVVALINFEMDGVHSQPPSALIDEGIPSVIFETIAVREHDVAHRSFVFIENPRLAEVWTRQKLAQHFANR